MKLQTILKALFLIPLLCLTLQTAMGQGIQHIRLNIGTAHPLEGTSYYINIFRGGDKIKLTAESLEMGIGDKKKFVLMDIAITPEQFQSMVDAVMKIKPTDIVGGPHPDFLHSISYDLSIGNRHTNMVYSVASPAYQTDERKLNDFQAAYQLILNTARLDLEKLER
jgi:hypothetical protein